MKQKKTIEPEISESKTAQNRKEDAQDKTNSIKTIGCCILLFFFTEGGTYLLGYFHGADVYVQTCNLVMACLGAMVTIFVFAYSAATHKCTYDNGEHGWRFVFTYLIGMVCAMIYTQLPQNGWMFLILYIMLGLLSNPITGVTAATNLLMITVLISGADTKVFLLYFLSGIIGIALFSNLDENFKTGIPITLSLGCQLLLIFAVYSLQENKQFTLETFVIPGANIIINCVLLFLFLQMYCQKIVLKEKNRYQIITDPEFDFIKNLKQDKPDAYYHCVHTAYLTERICSDLKLNVPAAKCAVYYFKNDPGDTVSVPEYAAHIISQLRGRNAAMYSKEATVVMICDNVMTTLQFLAGQNQGENRKEVNYDRVIEILLEKRKESGAFDRSDLSIYEMKKLKNKLLEEKMYYDFLC